MTNIIEIKPYIRDFIEDNLDSAFDGKVYWLGEKQQVPYYPYCLLTVISENKDKRTSHHNGSLTESDRREVITTRYKTNVITVGIYNAFITNTYDDLSMDEAKEFAYEQIDRLEGLFEDFEINSLFSVQNISPIRPLHEVVDGGYEYRFEFDLTIGYNEPASVEKDYGHGVDVDIDNEDGEGEIAFEVTIDNSDTINIEIKE